MMIPNDTSGHEKAELEPGSRWCKNHGGLATATLDSWPGFCADCYYKLRAEEKARMSYGLGPGFNLGTHMVHDFVHRAMVKARDENNFDELAKLPSWARRMIEAIGQNAGLKSDAVRELVGDD